MINLTKKLNNIQQHIDKIEQGHCLLIKLMNYDELYSMYSYAQSVVIEFYRIVMSVCKKHSSQYFSQIEYNKILIIIPTLSPQDLKYLSYEIYSQCQLYINDQLPSAYINCYIASINFPESSIDAAEIYTLLINRLTGFSNHHYYQPYDGNMHNIEKIKANNKKLNLLRKAIIDGSLKFDYQPILERRSGKIPYYECLLRFPDENNNFISGGPMIKAAEMKGLINIIDHCVIEMAVKELSNDLAINLSVNISNIGIIDDNLLAFTIDLLDKYPVADRLIIEITETAINHDHDKTKLFMDSLKKYGCKFALDDFGSGFTSFKQLQTLPIDIVKIDGSYIRDIVNNSMSEYFVKSLIKMCEDLKIKTVAEFVENGETAKFLMDINIDGMQGDFFSPAMSTRPG